MFLICMSQTCNCNVASNEIKEETTARQISISDCLYTLNIVINKPLYLNSAKSDAWQLSIPSVWRPLQQCAQLRCICGIAT
jgi:hypothetical protein